MYFVTSLSAFPNDFTHYQIPDFIYFSRNEKNIPLFFGRGTDRMTEYTCIFFQIEKINNNRYLGNFIMYT